MSYLPILVPVLLGVIVLIATGIPVIRSLRRFRAAGSLVHDRVGDGVSLLRARSAALAVAFTERRKDRRRR